MRTLAIIALVVVAVALAFSCWSLVRYNDQDYIDNDTKDL